MQHEGCKGCKYEREDATSVHCSGCKQTAMDKYTRRTNADTIRAMTDEELVDVILCPYDTDRDYCGNHKSCYNCCMEWLRAEVEE